MTLSQKFNLRNLPCFSFSIFSMNYLCLPAIGFTTLTLPLAKRFQMVKFNLVFFERFFQLFSYPLVSAAVSAGCKVKKLFKTTKRNILNFFLFSALSLLP